MRERIHLVVEQGRDKGKEITIPLDGARLGRSLRNDIVLVDPLLSRHHCLFFFRPGQGLWVTDLSSANRTLVNGTPVHEARIHTSDHIAVGETVLRVSNDTNPGTGARLAAHADIRRRTKLRSLIFPASLVAALAITISCWVFMKQTYAPVDRTLPERRRPPTPHAEPLPTPETPAISTWTSEQPEQLPSLEFPIKSTGVLETAESSSVPEPTAATDDTITPSEPITPVTGPAHQPRSANTNRLQTLATSAYTAPVNPADLLRIQTHENVSERIEKLALYQAIYSQQLDSIQTQLQAGTEARCETYTNALHLLQRKIQKTGDYHGSMSLAKELQRFLAEYELTADSLVEEPAALRALQSRHLQAKTEQDMQGAKRILQLHTTYVQRLILLRSNLTREDRLTDASVVDAEIRRVQANH